MHLSNRIIFQVKNNHIMSCNDCAIILVLGVDLNKIPFTDEMRIQHVFCLDYGPNISSQNFHREIANNNSAVQIASAT